MRDDEKTPQEDRPNGASRFQSGEILENASQDDQNATSLDSLPPSAETEPVGKDDEAASEAAEPVQTSESADLASDPPSEPTEKAKPSGEGVIYAKPPSLWFWKILIVLLLLAVLALGGAIYWGYDQGKASIASQQHRYGLLQEKLDGQSTWADESQAARKSLERTLKQGFDKELQRLQARVKTAEDRLVAQRKRLLSMSTTTREDWLLAEAEYLLRLANQRILVERSAEGADALLAEADGILRDLDDPELFPLRQAIADDLAALRLTRKIDREGIYLQLRALTKQVEHLPIIPTWQQYRDGVDAKQADASVHEQSPPGNGQSGEDEGAEARAVSTKDTSPPLETLPFYQRLLARVTGSFRNFQTQFSDYMRIRPDGEQAVPALLPPNEAQYLQQNLHMILERGQLALLREQQTIYRQSLEQARVWLDDYYPSSQPVVAFQEQLVQLESKTIVQNLPNISNSLELLHTYIEELHALGAVKKNTTPKKASASASKKRSGETAAQKGGAQ